jgi:hypothetical protein
MPIRLIKMIIKNEEEMISEVPFKDLDWVRISWVNIKLIIPVIDEYLRMAAGNVDIFIRINIDGVIRSMAVMLGMNDLNEYGSKDEKMSGIIQDPDNSVDSFEGY